MAKKNPGDILTCDWNPIIGCEKCSPGCRKCWYIDALLPWLKRLGKVPVEVDPNEAFAFENRMSVASSTTTGCVRSGIRLSRLAFRFSSSS